MRTSHRYEEEREDGKERVKLCRCLSGQTVRTWGRCHTCPLPFNLLGTKYLMLREQNEESCPYPIQSEVKQGLLPKYMHPTTSPLLSNDSKNK